MTSQPHPVPAPPPRTQTAPAKRYTYKSLFEETNATRNKYYHNPITARTQDSMERVNAILVGIDDQYNLQAASLDEVSTLEDGTRKALMAKVDERLRRPLDFDVLKGGTQPARPMGEDIDVNSLGVMRGFEPPPINFKAKDDAWLGVAEPIPAKDLFFVDTKETLRGVRPIPEGLVPAAGPKRAIFDVITTLNSLLSDLHQVLLQASSTSDVFEELTAKQESIVKLLDDEIAKVKSNRLPATLLSALPSLADYEKLEAELQRDRQLFNESMLHVRTAAKQKSQYTNSGSPSIKMQSKAGTLMHTASHLRDKLSALQRTLDVRSNPSETIIRSLKQKLFHETAKVSILNEELWRYKVTSRFRQNARARKEERDYMEQGLRHQTAVYTQAKAQVHSAEVDATCFTTLRAKTIVCIAADDCQLIKENLPQWCGDRMLEMFCDAVLLLSRRSTAVFATNNQSGPTVLKSDHHEGRFIIAFDNALDAQKFAFDLQYVLLGAPWPQEALKLVLPSGYEPLAPIRATDVEVAIVSQLGDEPSRNFCRYVDDTVLEEKREMDEANRRATQQALQSHTAASSPTFSVRKSPVRTRSPLTKKVLPDKNLQLSANAQQVITQLANRYPFAMSQTLYNAPIKAGEYLFRGMRCRVGMDIGDVVIEGAEVPIEDPEDVFRQLPPGEEFVIRGVYGRCLFRSSALAGAARGGEIVLSTRAKEQLMRMLADSSVGRSDVKFRLFCAPMSQHTDQISYYSSSYTSPAATVFSQDEAVFCLLPIPLLYRCYHFLAEPHMNIRRRVCGAAFNPLWFEALQLPISRPPIGAPLRSTYRGCGSSAIVSAHSPNAHLFSLWAAFVEEANPLAMSDYLSHISTPLSSAEEAQAALYAASAMHSIAQTANKTVVKQQKKLRLMEAAAQREASRLLAQHDICPIDAVAAMLTRCHISKWDNIRRAEGHEKGTPNSFVCESLSLPLAQYLSDLSLQHRAATADAGGLAQSRRGSVSFLATMASVSPPNPKTFLRMAISGGWDLLNKQQIGLGKGSAQALLPNADATLLTYLAAAIMTMENLDAERYAEAAACKVLGLTAEGSPLFWTAATLAATIAISIKEPVVHWVHWNQMILSSASPTSLMIDPLAVRSNLLRAQRGHAAKSSSYLTSRSLTVTFASPNSPSDHIPLSDIALHFVLLHMSEPQMALSGEGGGNNAPKGLLTATSGGAPKAMMITRTGSTVPNMPTTPKGRVSRLSSIATMAAATTSTSNNANQYAHLESLALLSQHRRALTGATMLAFDRPLALPDENPESAIISIQHCGFRDGTFMMCSLEDGIGGLLGHLLTIAAARKGSSGVESNSHNSGGSQGRSLTATPQSDYAERLAGAVSKLLTAFEKQYALAPLYMLPVMDVATSARYLRQEFNNTVGAIATSPSTLSLATLIAGSPYQQQLLHFVSPLAATVGTVKRPFTTVQRWSLQLARTISALHAVGQAAGTISSTYSLFLRTESDTANLFLLQAGPIHYLSALRESARDGHGEGSAFNIKGALETLPPEAIITFAEAQELAKANQRKRGLAGAKGKGPDPPGAAAIAHLLQYTKPPMKAINAHADMLMRLVTEGLLEDRGRELFSDSQNTVHDGIISPSLMEPKEADVWQFGTALFELATGSKIWQTLRMTASYSDAAYGFHGGERLDGSGTKTLGSTMSQAMSSFSNFGASTRQSEVDTSPNNALTMAYLEAQYGSILRDHQDSSSPIFPTLLDAFKAIRLGMLTASGIAVGAFDIDALWPNMLLASDSPTRVKKSPTGPAITGIAISPPNTNVPTPPTESFKFVVEDTMPPASPMTPSSKRRSTFAGPQEPPMLVVEQAVTLVLFADLLQRVLQVNPAHRPSIDDITAHPYFLNVPHVVGVSPSLSQWLLESPSFVCGSAASRASLESDRLAAEGYFAAEAPALMSALGHSNEDALYQVLQAGSCVCDNSQSIGGHAPASQGAALLKVSTHPINNRRRAAAVALMRAEADRLSVPLQMMDAFYPAQLMGSLCREVE